ncbi:kelch repeat [Fusarium albosuccineum]|uniref:Kelch repeat n=1 Tax=Fusarium albosuccineum TaxID=1237068 RepID=A0A8H4L7R5_9HYPO|nr:kelch repeat [Fusarium albosuccineum]
MLAVLCRLLPLLLHLAVGLADYPETPALQPRKDEESTNNPSAENYGYRVGHSSGEIALNDSLTDLIAVNSTLSISLDTAWSISNVEIKEFAKGSKESPPPRKDFSLWTSGSQDRLWLWGGSDVGSPKASDDHSLWELTVSEDGGGKWARKDTDNVTGFDNTQLLSQGLSASCGTSGVTFGGWSSPSTDNSSETTEYSLEVVDFNSEYDVWEQQDPPDGFLSEGDPTDPTDLVFFLGGVVKDDEGNQVDIDGFRNVTMYQARPGNWLFQTAIGGVGDVPTPRINPCVAVGGDSSGGYGIFVYGGARPDAPSGEEAYDQVYVLAIPAFRWFLLDVKGSTPRHGHSCVIMGTQLISVGGRRTYGDNSKEEQDPWNRGIQILDLQGLKWGNRFDPDNIYMSPAAVQNWYVKGGLDSVKWDDEYVKSIFITPEEKKSKPIGAIVGGTLGGVAALAIGIAAVFFWRRKKRAPQKSKTTNLSRKRRVHLEMSHLR